MLNQTALSEPVIAGGKQNIASVKIHLLKNIPIQPPPYRKLPKTKGALLMAIETNDSVVGWWLPRQRQRQRTAQHLGLNPKDGLIQEYEVKR